MLRRGKGDGVHDEQQGVCVLISWSTLLKPLIPKPFYFLSS